ncbi:Phenylacetate-coenzyme A ligase [Nymphon striatum]|nr:Phenylacetate-coenzyme A ligase [Nymphon striatum]
MGELVFTTITKEGLPMIRYRTRDLTRLLPGSARSMRRMEKITGRSDDMIILRGRERVPNTGRMDAMAINVEAATGAEGDATREMAGKLLSKKIKDVVGISTKVTVGETGTVERSQGKARRVVDNRPKE